MRLSSRLTLRAVDRALVPHRGADRLAGRGVPQAQRVVLDQERMRLSSLLNSAPLTEPSCCSEGPIGLPVAASHRRSVLSLDQERMRLSSLLSTAP